MSFTLVKSRLVNSRIRWLLWPSLLCLVTACGESSYPHDWPGLAHGFLQPSDQCPNVSGTYRVDAQDAAFPLNQTFVGASASTSNFAQWETMTVSQESDNQLSITLSRSPETMQRYLTALENGQAHASGGFGWQHYRYMFSPGGRQSDHFKSMTDDQYEKNLENMGFLWPVKTFSLQVDCQDGWIKSTNVQAPDRQDHDTANQSVENAEVLVGKDQHGNLVAQKVYAQKVDVLYQYLNICWGEACLFNYHDSGLLTFTVKKHEWARWMVDQPAWNGSVARPWAEPYENPRPPLSEPLPAETVSSVNLSRLINPLLPHELTMLRAYPDQDYYKLELVSSFDNTLEASRLKLLVEATMRHIENSDAFEKPYLASMQPNNYGSVKTVLWLKESPGAFAKYGLNRKLQAPKTEEVTPSSTSLEDISVQVKALAPTGLVVSNIYSGKGGFYLKLLSPDESYVNKMLRKLADSKRFANLERIASPANEQQKGLLQSLIWIKDGMPQSTADNAGENPLPIPAPPFPYPAEMSTPSSTSTRQIAEQISEQMTDDIEVASVVVDNSSFDVTLTVNDNLQLEHMQRNLKHCGLFSEIYAKSSAYDDQLKKIVAVLHVTENNADQLKVCTATAPVVAHSTPKQVAQIVKPLLPDGVRFEQAWIKCGQIDVEIMADQYVDETNHVKLAEENTARIEQARVNIMNAPEFSKANFAHHITSQNGAVSGLLHLTERK